MRKKYFKLQLKSAFKLYPTILLITILTILSIVATCVILLQTNNNSENKQKISIGVVGDTQETFLDLGIQMLEKLDSSQFYIEILNLTEEDAIKALEKREINGYIYIPDNYIRNIYRGINSPAKYVTLSSPEGFGTIASAEVAKIVSDIVTESQNGMYSMQDLSWDYSGKVSGKDVESLIFAYVNFILNRANIYTINILGISDSLSFGGYYICGFLILFMTLWGISCNKIFSSRKITYSQLLKISGLKTHWQIWGEYASYLIISTLTLLLFAIIFGIVMQFVDLGISELVGLSITSCMLFIIGILPVIIMITLMQTAIYELIPNTVGAVLAQFILAIGLGYISGCFYPNYFFPEIVQKIAHCLPVGAAFSYVRKVMSGSLPIQDFCIVAVYTVIFAYVTVWTRNYKITGDIK